MNSLRSRSSVTILAAFASAAVMAGAPARVDAAAVSGQLMLSGAVQGAVTVLDAKCNSHVAVAKHKFFFDIGGMSSGRTFLISGVLARYTGPGTYHSFSGLVMAGGHYFTAHGSGAGWMTVDGASTSAAMRLTVEEAPGAGGATAVVSGRFSCTAFTNA